MLSGYAKGEWLTIIAIGVMVSATCFVSGWFAAGAGAIVIAAALAAFFRDPDRAIPSERSILVSPADGRVSSIHRVEHFEPFGGPAQCVRIFLSVFDVHVARNPCHARVARMEHKPGRHLNALNPDSAEANESVTLVLDHPIRQAPVAVVRLVAGMIARTITCRVSPGQTLQRGQRIGIIKLGSTVELYAPESAGPQVRVQQGQRVVAGVTPLLAVAASPVRGGAGVEAPTHDVVAAPPGPRATSTATDATAPEPAGAAAQHAG